MKIYIAGSSSPSERERVQYWSHRLFLAGFEIVSTWPAQVAKYGEGNPREISSAERRVLAANALAEVAGADLLWFLVPSDETTRGAWGELCFAYAKNIYRVSSGDTKQSIFCALGVEFAADYDAFEFIWRLYLKLP